MKVDPTEQDVEDSFVWEARLVHGVDIQALDHFFATAAMPEKTRAKAKKQRREASAIYAAGNNLEHSMEIIRHLMTVRAVFEQIVPLASAQKAYGKRQREKASRPRKIAEEDRRRIAQEYWQHVAEARTPYGVVKALAARNGVTTQTIRDIASEFPPNSIAK